MEVTHPAPFRRGVQYFVRFYGMLIDGLEYRYVNGFPYKTVNPVALGASFLIQPKIVKVPELIEVPTVYETTKVVEVPKIIEVPAGAKVKRAPAGSEAPSTTPGKPPAPESHPWSELTDKQYVGVITDIIGDHVCFDHGRSNDHCVWLP